MTDYPKLRRADKEITDPGALEALLQRAEVCRLGMCDGSRPYVIPMSYGYRGGVLYFHSFRTGRKIDILKNNPAVCFEIDLDLRLRPSDSICNLGFRYRSILGFGEAVFIADPDKKREALHIIAERYTDSKQEIPDRELDKVTVFSVRIDHMTGKKVGYDAPAAGL